MIIDVELYSNNTYNVDFDHNYCWVTFLLFESEQNNKNKLTTKNAAFNLFFDIS